MTSSAFKGRKGLDSNNFEVVNVADPTQNQSATNRLWSETYIRLNDYDPTLEYGAGRFVWYQGRIWKANKTTGPSTFIAADWDRLNYREYPKVISSGTLEDQDIIFANNVSSAITFQLPANPDTGTKVEILDTLYRSNQYPITVETTDSESINGEGTSYVIQTNGDHLVFVYNGNRWAAISTLIPLSTLIGGISFLAGIGQTIYVRNNSSTSDTSITLPSNARRGDLVRVMDVRPQRTRDILVNSSAGIDGGNTSYSLQTGDQLELTFVSDTVGWVSSSINRFTKTTWAYTETDVTVSPGQSLMVNSTGGPVTITLPISGVREGTACRVVDQGRQTHINEISVQPPGTDTINGQSSAYILEQVGEDSTFVYFNGDWKVAAPESSEKRTWQEEITTTTDTVTFPTLNDLSEIFVNGTRVEEDVEYTADYQTGTLTFGFDLSPGDLVTNVTLDNIGAATASTIVRLTDEGNNRFVYRLRADNRLEERKAEGLGVEKTIDTDLTRVDRSQGALYGLKTGGNVVSYTGSDQDIVETGIDALAADDSGYHTVVINAGDWVLDDNTFTETISTVGQFQSVTDYVSLVVDDTDLRVYDLIDFSVFQSVTITAGDQTFLNDDGSIWVDNGTTIELYISGTSSQSFTVTSVDSVRGISGEVVSLVGTVVNKYLSGGTSSTLIDLGTFGVGTPASIGYHDQRVYVQTDTHLVVVDYLTGDFINAIPFFDGETLIEWI